jgi:hypothetical protein
VRLACSGFSTRAANSQFSRGCSSYFACSSFTPPSDLMLVLSLFDLMLLFCLKMGIHHLIVWIRQILYASIDLREYLAKGLSAVL